MGTTEPADDDLIEYMPGEWAQADLVQDEDGEIDPEKIEQLVGVVTNLRDFRTYLLAVCRGSQRRLMAMVAEGDDVATDDARAVWYAAEFALEMLMPGKDLVPTSDGHYMAKKEALLDAAAIIEGHRDFLEEFEAAGGDP